MDCSSLQIVKQSNRKRTNIQLSFRIKTKQKNRILVLYYSPILFIKDKFLLTFCCIPVSCIKGIMINSQFSDYIYIFVIFLICKKILFPLCPQDRILLDTFYLFKHINLQAYNQDIKHKSLMLIHSYLFLFNLWIHEF